MNDIEPWAGKAVRDVRWVLLAAVILAAGALTATGAERPSMPLSAPVPMPVSARGASLPAIPRPPREASGHGNTTATGASAAESGALPTGVTVFDDTYAGIARLDPRLLRALRAAATDARADGVTLFVNSGWRSRERQARLLRDAVARYGSKAEAARWVASPETSSHVSGDAVDLGHADATAWLAEHGARYGLCRVYRNEPWHYEFRPAAVARGCPSPFADATRDPRMQHRP